jgi:hypothetical protein
VLCVLVVTTYAVLNWLGPMISVASSKGQSMVVIVPAVFVFILYLGVSYGLASFLFLEALFRSVDWLDNLMRTKTTEKSS